MKILKKLLPIILCVVLAVTVVGIIPQETDSSYAASSTVTQNRYTADVSSFPSSYQSYLNNIKKAYPNASFVYYDTGLSWSDILSSDAYYYPFRCTVPNSKGGSYLNGYTYPSSYKAVTLNDAFDFTANEWVEQEGGWTQASEELIQYYADPRNYLNTTNIFSFLSTSYDASLDTETNVDSVLKNTFMHSSKKNTISVPLDSKGNPLVSVATDGTILFDEDSEAVSYKEMTYAAVFCLLGEELNVSAIALANRVRNEQGTDGTSSLISGKYSGYEGYYNYFNMGATGSTETEVIKNGLAEAQNAGWNTPYKSLLGGAAKYASRYVNSGRNTPYLLKFNGVVSGSSGSLDKTVTGTVSYSPYMTSILSPESEGKSTYNAFVNLSLIHDPDSNGVMSDLAFQFVIPVFSGMPSSACAIPTGDGNPNYKLKNITVNGGDYSIGTFKTDTKSYSTVVPYETSTVTIKATPYAETSTITIGGKNKGSGSSSYSQDVSLSVGDNNIEIVCKAENGKSKRTYTINVHRESSSGELSYSFKNATYDSSSKMLSGLTLGETVDKFLSSHVSVSSGTAQVVDTSGKKVSSSNVIATGQKLQILDSNSSVKLTVTLVVKGDLNGDGKISVMDPTMMKRHMLGIEKLDSCYQEAADLNNDGKISVIDFTKLKRHILNIESIY